MSNYATFLKEECHTILQKLTNETSREWGLMDAQQMVEHLVMTTTLSVAPIEIPLMGTEEQAQKAYYYIFTKKKPFRRGIKVPGVTSEPVAYEFDSIDEAKEALVGAVETFYKYYEANPDDKKIHPAFGALNFKDWEEFHARHVQHHLAQFGLWEIQEA